MSYNSLAKGWHATPSQSCLTGLADINRGETYQFAAIIGFPKGLTLFDFGFILIFGIEDLFFFFCNSRPILAWSPSQDFLLRSTTYLSCVLRYKGEACAGLDWCRSIPKLAISKYANWRNSRKLFKLKSLSHVPIRRCPSTCPSARTQSPFQHHPQCSGSKSR